MKQTKKAHRKAVAKYHASDMYHWHRRVAASMLGYRSWKWNAVTNTWERGVPNQWLAGVGITLETKNETD